MKTSLRRSVATLVGSFALSVAPAAFAVGEPCFNDDDCPGGGGAVCGGDVCKWGELHAMPDGRKVYICVAAGTDAKGKDGWCETDANCKCRSLGATCKTPPYCTFTKPDQAPAGGGGSGAGGGATTAGTAGTGTAGTGTAGSGSKPPPTDEGGCSVGAPGRGAAAAGMLLALFGLGALARRRR